VPQLVESSDAARGLADHVLDPGRERPIVCVSVPRRDSEPLVNVEEMEAAVGQVADVWVVRTGDATWELAHRLPVGLDVYDGAVRLWWPGLDEAADRFAHPLFFVYSASDSAAVIARVVAALEQGGSLRRAVTEPGSEHAATVTGITADGAELELADGTPAFAHRAHLSRHGLPPRQVVRVAQAVRVRVGDSDPARRRVPVSLLPFEPDPWGRLLADHPEGSLVEVVVRQLRNNGAIVEVLPELTGWVPKPEISHEYLQHPEDVLWVGHRVVARIERVDGEGRRVILSLLDVAADGPGRAAAIYPDGPGWLVPQVPAAAAQPDVVAAVVAEPETVAESSPADLPAPAQPVTTPAPSDEASPEQGELAADRLPAAAGEAEDESGQVDELEQVVAQAREIQREVRVLLDERDRQLARLRGEAAEIRRGLERDLAEVRQRILETLETESGQLIGSTQQALEDARRDAEDLRARLAAAEQDRQELVERLRESSRRADVAERTTAEIRERLRRERATTQQLHNQIQRLAPDEKTRLRDEIHTVWHQVTTPDDRQRYPWREPVVGVEFVDSLSRVQGVAHDRILRVCAEVVCRRAVDVPGMDVHPLRESLAGDAPQHVRADGAKAYRASLRPPEVGEPHVG
jgi:predicted RNA-binding protein with RPS1 domain